MAKRIRKTVLNDYTKMFHESGPVPNVQGAGKLTESVQYADKFDCVCDSELGDQYSRRCTWRVRHYSVDWKIQRGYKLRVVGGLITAVTYAGWSKSRQEPVSCYWAEKSSGYSGKWVSGFLYRGFHSKSVRGLKTKIDKIRRKAAENKVLSRHFNHNMAKISKRVWVSPESLRSVGACWPGINQAVEELKDKLQACGDIGACRADYLLSLGGKYAYYTTRILEQSYQQA